MTRADPILAEGIILIPTAGPMGPPGEKGDPGPTGAASALPAVWTGQGAPPDVIEGAKPGDTWIDLTTGTTYTLTADADARRII